MRYKPILTPLILAAIAGCASNAEQAAPTTFAEAPVVEEPAPPPQEVRVLVQQPKRKKRGKRTATPTVVDAVTEFPYEPTRVYQVALTPGYITAIHLEPGEKISGSLIISGDTACKERSAQPADGPPCDWVVSMTRAGTTEILGIVPLVSGLRANLVIPTDRRAYQIDLISYSKRAMDMVRWTYPGEDSAARPEIGTTQTAAHTAGGSGWCSPGLPGFDPRTMDRNFTVQLAAGDKPAWMPTSTWSVCGKTYVEFPQYLGRIPAPPMFLVRNGALVKARFRAVGWFYEIDQSFSVAELRHGDSIVRIVHGSAS